MGDVFSYLMVSCQILFFWIHQRALSLYSTQSDQGDIFNTNANLSIQICQFHGMVNLGLSKSMQILDGFNLNSKRLWHLCGRRFVFSRCSHIWLVSGYLHTTFHSVWHGARGECIVRWVLLAPLHTFPEDDWRGVSCLTGFFLWCSIFTWKSFGVLWSFFYLMILMIFLLSETKVIEN